LFLEYAVVTHVGTRFTYLSNYKYVILLNLFCDTLGIMHKQSSLTPSRRKITNYGKVF
jgi:hypothetical protein